MNVGVIFVALIILSAGLIGIAGMMSYHSDPVVDTMGHTYGNATNESIAAGNTVAETGISFGGYAVIAIALVIVAGLLVAILGLILYGGGRYTSTRR